MRVFVTGATGFIGTEVVARLLAGGHAVTGLARSEASAEALIARGASAHRGDLADPDSLAAGARAADAVIHLAFDHDFTQYAAAGEQEQRAVSAMIEALAGAGKPLVAASGTGVLPVGGTERDGAASEGFGAVRGVPEAMVVASAERGVRSNVVRLAPSVHDREAQGLVTMLIARARETGFSAYIGDGANRWPAVHRRDAARLFMLALEHGEPGARWHAVAEEGLPLRAIAEAIGEGLGLPARSLSVEEAGAHFGFVGMIAAADVPATSAITQASLGWTPTEPGLLAGLRSGGYLDAVR